MIGELLTLLILGPLALLLGVVLVQIIVIALIAVMIGD
jgi:hypothetical protein